MASSLYLWREDFRQGEQRCESFSDLGLKQNRPRWQAEIKSGVSQGDPDRRPTPFRRRHDVLGAFPNQQTPRQGL